MLGERLVRNDEVSGSVEFHESPQILVLLSTARPRGHGQAYNAGWKRLWGKSVDLPALLDFSRLAVL